MCGRWHAIRRPARALSDAEEALGAARGRVSAAKEDQREIELSIERLREAREAKRVRYDEKKASVEAQMKAMRMRVRDLDVARDADDRRFSARSVEVGVHAREVRAEVVLARAEMETCRRAFDDAYKAYKAQEEGVAQCTGVETSAESGSTSTASTSAASGSTGAASTSAADPCQAQRSVSARVYEMCFEEVDLT